MLVGGGAGEGARVRSTDDIHNRPCRSGDHAWGRRFHAEGHPTCTHMWTASAALSTTFVRLVI